MYISKVFANQIIGAYKAGATVVCPLTIGFKGYIYSPGVMVVDGNKVPVTAAMQKKINRFLSATR